jgi:sirohydrochlorin ferrochelatase
MQAAAAWGVRDLVVYPFFMSRGWIVEEVLTRRLETFSGIRCDVLPPLGLDPGLPSLLHEAGLSAAVRAGFVPGEARLLLAAHGSRQAPAHAATIARIADGVRSRGTFAEVQTAFLDHEPFVGDALRGDARPTVVAGCFAGEGVHACADIPRAIAKAGGSAAYTGPIGTHPGVADLVMRATGCNLETRGLNRPG